MLSKGINKLRKHEEEGGRGCSAAEPKPTKEEMLLTEIRDLLKEKKQ